MNQLQLRDWNDGMSLPKDEDFNLKEVLQFLMVYS